MKIPIQDVKMGDTVNGKPVVDVLHRQYADFFRLVLKGGQVVQGYRGEQVEVERMVTNATL